MPRGRTRWSSPAKLRSDNERIRIRIGLPPPDPPPSEAWLTRRLCGLTRGRLDRKYPALLEVRQALVARQEEMMASGEIVDPSEHGTPRTKNGGGASPPKGAFPLSPPPSPPSPPMLTSQVRLPCEHI